MKPLFADRHDAGRQLAARLSTLQPPAPVTVLALPRGGVAVAVPVARALQAPLELLLVRKIGLPWQPELALAAVVEGDPPDVVVDEPMRARVGVDTGYIAEQAAEALREIARRRALYCGGRPPPELAGRTVIVVDDGLATGTTVRAALKALRRRGAAALWLAVPLAPHDTVRSLEPEVDRLVCLQQPRPFDAIGLHYGDFRQLDDDEVLALLASVPAPG